MLVAILLSADYFQIRDLSISSREYATELTAPLILVDLVAPDHHQHAENSIGKLKDLRMTKTTEKIIIIQVVSHSFLHKDKLQIETLNKTKPT